MRYGCYTYTPHKRTRVITLHGLILKRLTVIAIESIDPILLANIKFGGLRPFSVLMIGETHDMFNVYHMSYVYNSLKQHSVFGTAARLESVPVVAEFLHTINNTKIRILPGILNIGTPRHI